jgi:hypothetical protein
MSTLIIDPGQTETTVATNGCCCGGCPDVLNYLVAIGVYEEIPPMICRITACSGYPLLVGAEVVMNRTLLNGEWGYEAVFEPPRPDLPPTNPDYYGSAIGLKLCLRWVDGVLTLVPTDTGAFIHGTWYNFGFLNNGFFINIPATLVDSTVNPPYVECLYNQMVFQQPGNSFLTNFDLQYIVFPQVGGP